MNEKTFWICVTIWWVLFFVLVRHPIKVWWEYLDKWKALNEKERKRYVFETMTQTGLPSFFLIGCIISLGLLILKFISLVQEKLCL